MGKATTGRVLSGAARPPAELEALVCEEAQRELQAREQEEVEKVDEAQAAQVAEPW